MKAIVHLVVLDLAGLGRLAVVDGSALVVIPLRLVNGWLISASVGLSCQVLQELVIAHRRCTCIHANLWLVSQVNILLLSYNSLSFSLDRSLFALLTITPSHVPLLVVNWSSVVLVLLELRRRALVRVVVVVGHAAVWLAWLDHAVGLEAATKLVPVDGWLIVVHAGAIVVVSTSVVHGLAGVDLARHHAVLNW